MQRRLRHRAKRIEAFFTFDQEHHTLVIHKRGGQGHAEHSNALTYDESVLFDGMAVAVAPLAEGLGSVRTSAAAAREVMRDLPMGSAGVFTLRDRWLSITRHRLSQLGCDPGQLVFPKLQDCAPQERARILEAATTFLGTGSLVETARKLFCHRNTVVNRLAAFERYTGLDLQNPTDLALAVLALHASTADP
ncbi:helix-turn-helix domain-containing protein [Arthrobacter sp. 2MCAF14]|uniref:helix-turn-helix domain-containing protein n=1 Tax=Arthrobacter sp. 2MCAF14 TaxID=3232982 RepID=UPI003F928FB1